MSSYFSIVQYLPDPVTDERINVGAVVVSGSEVKVQFLKNWRRAALFGNEDISFLKDFAKRFTEAAKGQMPIPGLLTDFYINEGTLRELADDWVNSIQFTVPRASTLPADDLFADVVTRYLQEQESRKRSRGRSTAARIVASTIRVALAEEIGSAASELLKRDRTVEGEVEKHRFDVVVGNGSPYLAAHALSFEVQPGPPLDRLVDATAWAVNDVRQKRPELPLAILALPPKKKSSETYQRARHVFSELDAVMLSEKDAAKWAASQAGKLGSTELARMAS